MANQQLAIQLALQNVNQVINGINTITNAWVQQGVAITKNRLALVGMMTAVAGAANNTAALMAQSATKTSDSFSGAGAIITRTITGWVDTAGKAAVAMAGHFKWLGGVASGLGTILGAVLGGVPGAMIGGAVGQLGGGIFGIFLDLPNKVFNIISGVVRTILGAIGSVINGFVSIGKSIHNLIFGPVSLFGLAIANIFRDIGGSIEEMTRKIFEAAVEFQRLKISIETMTRRNIARDLGIDILDVTAKQATDQTTELFAWLTKVSLTSPFTMKSIADAMKFASAMGLSIQMTKDLTLATGDFSAAMGLTDEHQYRIMYNLAQIYQQGKLTGREFRDLAISFVPVYDILGVMAKEVGMTTEAFKKLALAGGVPVQDFFKHFIDYMSTNYPDAMKKMSRTMSGVQNNIKDFIEVVLGMEVLGPLLDNVAERLAKVLDLLLTPRAHAIARSFGEGLNRAFEGVAQATNILGKAFTRLFNILGGHVPTIEDLANAFVFLYMSARHAVELLAVIVNNIGTAIMEYIMPAIRSLGGAQSESGNWGVNLVKNFAMGMIKGAARFIAMAIIFIRAMIEGFFGPGSPPKVAPEIDTYGADMMSEWINGAVNETDWDELAKGVQDAVDTVMGDIVPTPKNWTPPQAGTPTTGPEGYPGQESFPSAQDIEDQVSATVSAVSYFVTEQGMRLAADFMKGFTEADFSILDEIQGPLKSAISALTEFGQIAEGVGQEMFYNFSQDIIAAIDQFNKTGEISTSLINEISSLGMELGPELADLLIKEFDLAKATNDAAAAQERLDAAIENLGKARVQVSKLVKDYNALLRAGAGKGVLKSKLQEVNAAEQVVISATKEQIAAEENKKLADERVDKTKELVALQSKLVDNMIELLNTQNEAISSLKGGAGDLSEDFTQIYEDASTAAKEAFDNFEFDWEGKEKQWETEWGPFWTELGNSFASTMTAELGNLDTTAAANAFVNNLKDKIGKALGIEPLVSTTPPHPGANIPTPEPGVVIPQPWQPQPSFWQQMIDKLGGLLKGLNWDSIKQAFIDNFGVILAAVVTYLTVGPGWAIMVAGLKVFGAQIVAWLSTHGIMGSIPFLKVTADMTNTVIEDGNLGWWNALTPEQQMQFVAGGGIPPLGVKVPTTADIELGPLSETDLANQIATDLGLLNIPSTTIMAPFEIQTTPETIENAKTEGGKVGASMGEGVTFDFSAKIIEFFNSIGPWIKTNIIDKILGPSGINGGSPAMTFVPIGTSMAEGIFKGFTDMVTDAIGPNGVIATAITNIINSIKSFFGISVDGSTTASGPLYGVGQSVVQGLADGIESMQVTLQEAIDFIVGLLPDWIKKLLKITSPSKVMMNLGKQTGAGFALGIEDSGKMVRQSLDKVLGSVTTPDLSHNLKVSQRIAYAPQGRFDAPYASRITNVNFGDVTINSGMDWAMFKAQVQRAITEG